ncbi:MAG: hypothetical protein AAGI54_03870 [Planctomycetota bacterium]
MFWLTLVTLTLFPGAMPALAGELQWSARRVSVSPVAPRAVVPVDFAFENVDAASDADATPIELLSVKPGCGCTAVGVFLDPIEGEDAAATTEPMALPAVIPPGRSGRLAVAFHVGSRRGVQRKPIVVRWHTPGVPRSEQVRTLVLEVDLPEAIQLEADAVVWGPGEPVEPRSVTVTIPASVRDAAEASGRLLPTDTPGGGVDAFSPDAAFGVVSARTTCPGTTIDLAEDTPGERYTLTIRARPGAKGEAVLATNFVPADADAPFEIVVPFEAALPSTAATERDADPATPAVHRVGHGCGPPSAASATATADASPTN